MEVTAQTPEPVVTPLQNPTGLAFDQAGNLWVNYNGGLVARLTAAERAATATVTPAVQVGLAVDVLAESLAFDEGGGLWFAYAAGKIARLGATQLGASGAAVVPDVVVTSTSVGSAGAVAFYPAPAWSPVYGRRP